MAATRKDVAERAGVSPGVVSYVLNGGPRPVAPLTRQRVLDAVKALGYRPDGLARSLRMGRTLTLGLVVPDASNPFFAELARAIENAAFIRGHAVLVCNSADDSTREHTYIQSLADRRVDGLILVSSTSSQDLSGVTKIAIPVVALDRSPDQAAISTIRSDNEHGAYLGACHLIGHGHRRIAFIGGTDQGVSGARRRGWHRAMAERGLAADLVSVAPFSYEGGFGAGKALFSESTSSDAPTAALVSSDVQALGLLSCLASMGSGVPGTVAVISFDGTNAGQYGVPPLTSITQPILEMAELAVSRLIDHSREVTHVTLPNTLTIRRSCGCTEGFGRVVASPTESGRCER